MRLTILFIQLFFVSCFFFVFVFVCFFFPGLELSVVSWRSFNLAVFFLHCENGDFSILMKDILVSSQSTGAQNFVGNSTCFYWCSSKLEKSNNDFLQVANLVESPVPLLGHFDEAFLKLPADVLTTVSHCCWQGFPTRKQLKSVLYGQVCIIITTHILRRCSLLLSPCVFSVLGLETLNQICSLSSPRRVCVVHWVVLTGDAQAPEVLSGCRCHEWSAAASFHCGENWWCCPWSLSND